VERFPLREIPKFTGSNRCYKKGYLYANVIKENVALRLTGLKLKKKGINKYDTSIE
jgi:hypothetical protein